MQTLAARMYPELIADIEKVHWLIRDAVSSNKHYAYCVGPVGEPKAVLIARVQNNMWAMKKSATILYWHSELPGAGRALLKDLKKWVTRDHHIVMVGLACDWFQPDPRLHYALTRSGFNDRGWGHYVHFPHGDLSGSV